MLCEIVCCIPCSCYQHQAHTTEELKAVSHESTTTQPAPILPPSQEQQKQSSEEARIPVGPAQDDPDTTLTVIEASIALATKAEAHDDIDEQTAPNVVANRASAPPNLELDISRDPLPDFSLNPRSRLSYWGPSSFSPPDQPLPAIPAAPHFSREGGSLKHSRHSPFYRSYFADEETAPRILRPIRSNPHLDNSSRSSL